MEAADHKEEQSYRLLAVCPDEGRFAPALEQLGRHGFEVAREPSVYRAVARFARRPADLAAVHLEGLAESELECIRVLRDLHPGAYIVAAFPTEDRRNAGRAVTVGADAYLLEPFYPEELVSLVRRGARRIDTKREERQDYRHHLEALARLAKGTAHQINNPLATLSGWLQMMKSEYSRRPEERQRLASMQEEVERIARVVERLQAFGQETPPECRPVDLNSLVAGEVRELRSGGRDLRLDADLEARGAVVWANEKLLRQACRLLLEEACRAAPGDGVAVTTRLTEEGVVELAVTERDGRLSAEEAERLFEPYAASSGSNGRAGLAYPAAYGIVRSHGGDMTVSSDRGRGTTVLVRLPQSSRVPDGGVQNAG